MSNPIEDIKAMVAILKKEPKCAHYQRIRIEDNDLVYIKCPECGFNQIYPKRLEDSDK